MLKASDILYDLDMVWSWTWGYYVSKSKKQNMKLPFCKLFKSKNASTCTVYYIFKSKDLNWN